MEASDHDLLTRYLSRRDEAAFGTLVGRYVDQVHALARRVTQNDDLARDVTQSAFIRLARRAAFIAPHLPLASWLHHTARCLAVDVVRAESRRRKREQAAAALPQMDTSSPPEPDWSRLSPVVDALVDHLPAKDRDLVLLRYYRNESHAAIAARLGLSEPAVRKRTSRALEKLRTLLAARGLATSTAALAAALPAHAAPAAPAALTPLILQAAAGIAPAAPGFLTSALLSVTTAQKIALAGSLLLLLGVTGFTWLPGMPGNLPPTTAHVVSPGSPDERKPPRERTARAVPATAEERRARLEVIIAMKGRTERKRALLEYLDALSPALFPETLEICADRLGGDRENDEDLLLGAWLKIDAPAAMTYAQPLDDLRHPRQRLLIRLFRQWAAMDLHAARAWAAENPTVIRPWVATHFLIRGSVGHAPAEALQIALDEEEPDARSSALADVLNGVVDYPEAAEELLKAAGPERDRYAWRIEALQIDRLCSSDPAEALRRLHGKPEVIAQIDRQRLIGNLIGEKVERAAPVIEELAPAGLKDFLMTEALSQWLNADPSAASAWLEAHPQSAAVMQTLPAR